MASKPFFLAKKHKIGGSTIMSSISSNDVPATR
jgi:hypothetical protein